jgi:hypothetical protein
MRAQGSGARDSEERSEAEAGRRGIRSRAGFDTISPNGLSQMQGVIAELGMASVTNRPNDTWRDWIGLALWGAAAAAVVGALNQRLFLATLDSAAALTMIGILVVAAPFMLGLIGGGLIRVDRPHKEVLVIAAVGAACVFATLDVLWNATPNACTEPDGCDISLGFGAALTAGLSFMPFLGGTALGRFLRRLVSRRLSRHCGPKAYGHHD